MKLNSEKNGSFSIKIDEKELKMIFSCVREVFACFDKREFEARIGFPFPEVKLLLEEFMREIDKKNIAL